MTDEKCNVPPEGWFCTREPNHDGPCAAHPVENSLADELYYRLHKKYPKKYTEFKFKFGLYKEQLEEANSWREQHIKEKHNNKYPYAGAIGGAFGWKFIETSVGIVAICSCMCGDEINVSDFSNW